jgi:NADPH-dependent 2,4-dienoyl-CoA reductase/sulfur reductase-like enzyme
MSDFKYLILGGGMVAGYAAKALVKGGLRPDELAIISSDDAPPYERPPLSKDFLAGVTDESQVFINPPSFYEDAGIALRLSTTVERIVPSDRKLYSSGGDEFGFEKLLVATGTRVRTLDVAGATLPGVMYLRSLDDSRRLRDAYKNVKRAVVIGAGFIGMEVASVLAGQGVETTMVFPENRVWERFFTPPMSAYFERYYAERGVSFAREEKVDSIGGTGHVESVNTQSGTSLPAELVVAGIGVVPVTDLLSGTGIALDNGVVVNEFLETNVPNVWAAGDVARYRDVIFDKQRRIEHWDNAVEQGKHAARLMLGNREPFVHVPYFFSDVFDLSYEFWGDTADADDVVYRGDLTSGSFSTWWLRAGMLVAAFLMKRPKDERDIVSTWIKEHRQIQSASLRDADMLADLR